MPFRYKADDLRDTKTQVDGELKRLEGRALQLGIDIGNESNIADLVTNVHG